MITYNEAINQLETRTNGLVGEELKKELTKIINEVSVYAEGNITCLYAGTGTPVAATMINDPDIRVIDKTDASKLLLDLEFREKVGEAFGLNPIDLQNIKTDYSHPFNQFLVVFQKVC